MSKRFGVSKWIGVILLVLVVAVLAYVFLVRPWHMRWGARDGEISAPLPGDRWTPARAEVSTRSITIHAPVSQVWPWVAQLGQERGGFYSYDWLENLFLANMHNADRLLPEAQRLKVGDRFSYMEDGPPGTYGEILLVEPEHSLVVGAEGWTWVLEPAGEGATRLIVRYPFTVGAGLLGKFFYYAWFESAHFVMESGMMMGIKQRAEALGGD
jgi:hypothetical protein